MAGYFFSHLRRLKYLTGKIICGGTSISEEIHKFI